MNKDKLLIATDFLVLGLATILGLVGNVGLAIAGIAVYLTSELLHRLVAQQK